MASLCPLLVFLYQSWSVHTYFHDPVQGLIITVLRIKVKGHQELPFRIALDDTLL